MHTIWEYWNILPLDIAQKSLRISNHFDIVPIFFPFEIMLWMFKDPINSGLAQFDDGQLNSKKWPKG